MKDIEEIGLLINEKEYRELDLMSYSLLSSVSNLGPRAINNNFKPTIGTKFGVLTESILFDDYVENDYYVINELFSEGKLKDACDIIFPYLVENSDKLVSDLSKYINLIEQAFSQLDIDYYSDRTAASRAKTLVKDSKQYWIDSVKGLGKIVITKEMLQNAKFAAQTLKTHQFTKHIFSKDSFFNIDKRSQVKLKFDYLGYTLKGMLDWLVINHEKKLISIFDLKTGSKPVESFEDSFYFWRYDIQAFLYSLAVHQMRDKYYPEYKIEPFKFVYISRNDVSRPIVWVPTPKHYMGTQKGFTRKGKYYKGVKELIKEYEWYLKYNNAEYSKEVYDASGELFINDDIEVNGV